MGEKKDKIINKWLRRNNAKKFRLRSLNRKPKKMQEKRKAKKRGQHSTNTNSQLRREHTKRTRSDNKIYKLWFTRNLRCLSMAEKSLNLPPKKIFLSISLSFFRVCLSICERETQSSWPIDCFSVIHFRKLPHEMAIPCATLPLFSQSSAEFKIVLYCTRNVCWGRVSVCRRSEHHIHEKAMQKFPTDSNLT